MLLYIVRHGDPDYANDTLTERGKLQAEAVGKRIAHAKVDKIFSLNSLTVLLFTVNILLFSKAVLSLITGV